MFNWLTSLFSKKTDWLLIEFATERTCGEDTIGFTVWRKEDWENYLEKVRTKMTFPQSHNFGEWIEFEFDSFEQYLSYYTVESISDTEAQILQKLFGDGYGTFFEFDDYDFPDHSEDGCEN